MATQSIKRYCSGSKDITPKSLLNNEQGITLLMRDYEEIANELKKVKEQNGVLIKESSAIRTSASYNIFTILFNIIGTVTISLAVNLITSANNPSWKDFSVLLLGVVIYFLSALMVIRNDRIVTCWNKLVEKFAVD